MRDFFPGSDVILKPEQTNADANEVVRKRSGVGAALVDRNEIKAGEVKACRRNRVYLRCLIQLKGRKLTLCVRYFLNYL